MDISEKGDTSVGGTRLKRLGDTRGNKEIHLLKFPVGGQKGGKKKDRDHAGSSMGVNRTLQGGV